MITFLLVLAHAVWMLVVLLPRKILGKFVGGIVGNLRAGLAAWWKDEQAEADKAAAAPK